MFVNFIFFLVGLSVVVHSSIKIYDCPKYKNQWQSFKNRNSVNFSEFIDPGTFTKVVCASSKCCDDALQRDMVALSHYRLKTMSSLHLDTISRLLVNSSTTINGFLVDNIYVSRRNMDSILSSTFKQFYTMQHKYLFSNLYDELTQYMEGKKDGLQMILDKFFIDIVVSIIGTMYQEKSLNITCIREHVRKDDAEYLESTEAVISTIMGTYPMTRMLLNGIRVAQDVWMDLIKEKSTPSLDCAVQFTRVFHCSLCSGSEMKPCESVCRWTVGRCLGSFTSEQLRQVNKSWKKLVVTLEKVSEKLSNTFNFLDVNKNLHLKISDVMSTVHSHFPDLKEKISIHCHKESIRKRRSIPWHIENSSGQYKHLGKLSIMSNDMKMLLKTFSSKLPELKNHLHKFKNIICTEKNSIKVYRNNQCWNGTSNSTGTSFWISGEEKKVGDESMDFGTMKAVRRMKEITSILRDMLSFKSRDPKAFIIEYVVSLNRTKERREKSDEESLEGSGVVSTSLPMYFFDTFPPFHIDRGTKKHMVSDDEDFAKPDIVSINVLQGSGSSSIKPLIPHLSVVITEEPMIKYSTSSTADKPEEGSGLKGSPDDESNKSPLILDSTLAPWRTTLDLPGEIPQEIWIPQNMK